MEQFRSTQSNIGESSHASGSCVGRAASNVSPPPPPLAAHVEQVVVPPVLAPPPPPLAPHVEQVVVPPVLAQPPPPPPPLPHVQPMFTPPEPQVPPTMHELANKTRDNIVASGYILKSDSTYIHGKKMSKEVACVVVEVAHEEMAMLPFPNLNAGITLKRKQEDIEAMIPSTQHPQPPKLPLVEPLTHEVESISHNDSTSMSSTLTSLLKFVSPWDNDHHKKINITSHVFGYNTIAMLFKDDVTQFCNMDKIGQTPMIFYLRLLDYILHTNGLDHLYAFQHPGEVSVGHENKHAQALKDRFIQMGEKQFLICPWNSK
ncbi:uncharacterized protein LOC133803418 isoform X2 [Humulus lupulus]|uniref:uncharacterized protein LOC133803418 isoform X2 n=1 Tax=Humulus lupulus TaxID=3486 RepID=UPI002B41135F|nr:uncharacterized protein LOC133803418 isoform X2 [Humulus lupulus]